MSKVLLMDLPICHVKADCMDRDVGVPRGVIGVSGECSKLSDHFGGRPWVMKLSLDTSYIGFRQRLCLVWHGVSMDIMTTDDDRASDEGSFLCTLF